MTARLTMLRRRRAWLAASMLRREVQNLDADRFWPAYCRTERAIYAILAAHPELNGSRSAA